MKWSEFSKKKKTWIIIIGVLFVLWLIGTLSPDDNIQKDTATESNNVSSNKNELVDSLKNDSIKKSELKLVNAEIDKLKPKFNLKYDDIKKTTWVYPKSKPYYDNTLAFYLYLGISDEGQFWKRLVIRYHGDDWLFIKSIIVKTDIDTYTVNASSSERDNNADVWEWIDIVPGVNDNVMIESIIKSKNIKVRFEGQKYYFDWNLGKKEVNALSDVLNYYSLLEKRNQL